MARSRATQRSTEATRRIIELARGQHGVFSTAQLEAADISWEAARSRREGDWLRRLHPGVYCLAGSVLSHRGRWLAAVLAAGCGAALSHLDAAALWRLIPPSADGPVHVSVPSVGGRRRRQGIVVHRCRTLPADELTAHDSIPVTTAARTVLDLATLVSRRRLERAIDEAEYLRLCTAEDLRALAERHRGRAGTALLAEVLGGRTGSTRTRSELEERFLGLCRDHSLPQPQVNAQLLGLTVDFFWPPGVVVEVDGGQAHRTRRAFQDDRDRDSLLAAHGHRVIRFTWWDVERRPLVVADRVRRVLARTGDSPA